MCTSSGRGFSAGFEFGMLVTPPPCLEECSLPSDLIKGWPGTPSALGPLVEALRAEGEDEGHGRWWGRGLLFGDSFPLCFQRLQSSLCVSSKFQATTFVKRNYILWR